MSLNALKPYFITVYCTVVFLSALRCLWLLIGMPSPGLLAANLALWPGALFFLLLFTGTVARTSRHVHLMWVSSVIGAIASVLLGAHSLEVLFHTVVVGGIASVLYVFWYSPLSRKTDAIRVGEVLPNFTLLDEQQQQIKIPEHFAGKPLLMIFYRGNWCPLCMAQLREVSRYYQRLADLGIETLLISPQPQNHIKSLSAKLAVPFHFFQDYQNHAAQQLQLVNEDGVPKGLTLLGYGEDTVHPTVIMTKADGEVIFADLTDNYRVRPEP